MDRILDTIMLSNEAIEVGMEDVIASPKEQGRLQMIVRRPKVNVREVLEIGRLDTNEGLVGDNWRVKGSRWRRGGDPKRQITVMNWRFARLIAGDESRIPQAGDQLYVDLDLSKENLPAGTRLAIGDALIEVTEPPHLGCRKFVERFGIDAMMFANSEFGRLHNLRGVNARVVNGGTVTAGDIVVVASDDL